MQQQMLKLTILVIEALTGLCFAYCALPSIHYTYISIFVNILMRTMQRIVHMTFITQKDAVVCCRRTRLLSSFKKGSFL